ncbi:MAG TPA: imidazole glycerol phosphate synthase subunit HisH [Candidatus Nanoarchaeia archaeon]|nr:imidazole glycerol phosphate synthase subunit HisH [Candidatus Nanoarchaeia archaeon]
MILIIDCGLGNLRNVQKVFDKLGVKTKVSNSIADIEEAKAYVLPGVGAFGKAMETLKSLGIIECIRKNVLQLKKPILGICLGMQLLGKESLENGFNQGLNLIPAVVRKLEINEELKLPHIGWNNIKIKNASVLLKNLPEDPDVYFVHSYHVLCDDPEMVAATCNYGQEFTAAIQYNNIFATQFHPEKSQNYGFTILKNFVEYINLNKEKGDCSSD